MKKLIISIVVISLFSSIIGCSFVHIDKVNNKDLPIHAPSIQMIIRPSSEGVDNFLKVLGEYNSTYNNDTCYNITPSFVSEVTNYQVFKFDQSCSSYLLYNNTVYQLGASFGGFGVTSMAITDRNDDGNYELYFTSSFGSGVHRAQVGYFDPIEKRVILFNRSYENHDCILTIDKNRKLRVNRADIYFKSNVDFISTARNTLGMITYIDNNIRYINDTQSKD